MKLITPKDFFLILRTLYMSEYIIFSTLTLRGLYYEKVVA